MNFGSLTRRLTAWYVLVVVALVVLLAGSVIAAGLLLYAKDVHEQIEAISRQIPDIENRARSERADWKDGEALLVRRLARPGLTVQAIPPPPGVHALPRNAEFGIFRLPDQRGARPSGAAGPARHDDRPFYGTRFGFVEATFLGIRPVRRPFLGGLAFVFVDLERLQNVVGISLAVLAATGILAGLVAWAIGRYITSQAMRPLYDVTSALVRFAGRDFTAQPIDVAGRTEFDELVRAYNAAAAQVQSAFDERAAAEGQMRQFVADAGHELRTPLTILLGYIDLLKRRAPDDERSRRIFSTIAIEGSRMRTLIDNLVLLARLEGDDVRPVEPFNLAALLQADIVEPRLGMTPGLCINLDLALDVTIIGDRVEVYEAIANVVDNALKYAPGSPIEIQVRPAPGGVEILVSDHGPGIATADRSAIFDRFYRGSLRGEVEGSGLGLAIAKRAIERAGGTLSLMSEPLLGGTTFAIRLRADQIHTKAPRTVRA